MCISTVKKKLPRPRTFHQSCLCDYRSLLQYNYNINHNLLYWTQIWASVLDNQSALVTLERREMSMCVLKGGENLLHPAYRHSYPCYPDLKAENVY